MFDGLRKETFSLFQGTNGATRKKQIEAYEQQLKNLCFPIEFNREFVFVPSFEERYPFNGLNNTIKREAINLQCMMTTLLPFFGTEGRVILTCSVVSN